MAASAKGGDHRPMVSVIMANYNGERFLRRAISSVLRQSVTDIELIVSDDGSSDASAEIVKDFARQDGRIRLLTDGSNAGPARARNRALDAAKGEWVAIVDSDDLLHPQRFERLLSMAARHQADIVADNLLHFHDDGRQPVSFLFGEGEFDRTFQLTPSLLVRGDVGQNGLPNFGYLKPVIRTANLAGLRYDERLKIGEDYDFMLRLLARGACFMVCPEPTYLYRRHGASISHRLSVAAVEEMIACQRRFQNGLASTDKEFESVLAARMAMLERGLRFEQLVAAIKARRLGDAFRLMAQDPRLARLLVRSLAERLSRKMPSGTNQNARQTSKRSQTILVTDSASNPAYEDADRPDWLIEKIPAYLPGDQIDVDYGPLRRAVASLVSKCQAQRSHLICDGPAGRYMVGFVPFDHALQDADALRHGHTDAVTVADAAPAAAGVS